MKPAQTTLDQAAKLLTHKDYRAAHALCLELLKSDSQQPRAYIILGLLTAEHDNHAKAIELFDRALKIEQSAEALALKARSLLIINRRAEAITAADAAANHGPKEASTLDTIGVVYSRAGLHERALPFYDQAIAANPHIPAYHYNRGAALQFLGRFNEAIAAYRIAAIDTNDYRSLAAAVLLEKGVPDTDDICALETMQQTAEGKNDAEACLHIGHALAKICEDKNDTTGAMVWLKRAKDRKKTLITHNTVEIAELFRIASDNAKVFNAPEQPSNARHDGPIFILGMPRTGTTLVDRIISSHSIVKSAGELSDISILVKKLSGTPSAFVLDVTTLRAAPEIDHAALNQQYKDGINNALGLNGAFTDKMPFNLFYVPSILAAIPDARIICLRRHPADTVLSNYRQLFATAFTYYSYAYDLEWCADYVAHFFQYMDVLQNSMPTERFQIVDYEALVTSFDEQVHQLLKFCNLPFEDACLSFHMNKAPVATASATQVRQPIYTSALARWKRYLPALDPALKILSERGIIDQDGTPTHQELR